MTFALTSSGCARGGDPDEIHLRRRRRVATAGVVRHSRRGRKASR